VFIRIEITFPGFSTVNDEISRCETHTITNQSWWQM
jgi:hypothetical protein